MKHFTRSLLILSMAFFALINNSCRKVENAIASSPRHLLGVAYDRIIKIDQAVIVYDSTSLDDSLKLVDPPGGSLYVWSVTPDSKAASFSRYYKNGEAEIIFSAAGNYQLSATIFDSADQQLTGHTDTVQVEVVKDTLFPMQAIQPNDQLDIHIGVGFSTPPDINLLILYLSTVDLYDYASPETQLNYTTNIGNNSYSFVFSDSVQLTSYPFAYGYGVMQPATAVINLSGLTAGVPTVLSFTWLNQTYAGTVTLASPDNLQFNFPNPSAVKIFY